MELSILLYVFGISLFAFLFYILEPRGYYWCMVRGYMEGVSSLNDFKKMFLQDIGKARREILIASCTADLSYWDENIIQKISDKLKKGVRFIFLVGPQASDSLLQRLVANNPSVELYVLNSDPPCDFRIIDESDTCISHHGYGGNERRFYRSFGGVKAVADRRKLFFDLVQQSRRVRLSGGN